MTRREGGCLLLPSAVNQFELDEVIPVREVVADVLMWAEHNQSASALYVILVFASTMTNKLA